jgi:hypothetical protein
VICEADTQALVAADWEARPRGCRESVDDICTLLHRESGYDPVMGECPELVGAAEIGRLLGVSRQRVHQLLGGPVVEGRPPIPEPVAELACGMIWLKSDWVRFSETWNRAPGRRPRASR